jgi:hypothetical protein
MLDDRFGYWVDANVKTNEESIEKRWLRNSPILCARLRLKFKCSNFAMLRTSGALQKMKVIKITGYNLFLHRVKDHPKLVGLSFRERASTTAKMWAELAQDNKDALSRCAKREGLLVHDQRSRRGRSKYHRFIKENMHKFKGQPAGVRLRAVAELWRSKGI